MTIQLNIQQVVTDCPEIVKSGTDNFMRSLFEFEHIQLLHQ